ncbi:MAG: hypothetical protein HY376_01075 [Candidatus Blackburnbacteria bacterium]|nr:hypothetical protein [Candidatus Blackburnbacteria bacterium]
MQYEELRDLNQKNQETIISCLENEQLSGLTTLKDFESILVSIVDDFANFKLSLDEFSAISGNLLLILQNNKSLENAHIGGIQLQDYLLMGDDISWYIRRDPIRAGEALKTLIDLSESLKRELFDNKAAIEKYPFLEPLDVEESRLIFSYLKTLRLDNFNQQENIEKFFMAVMKDFMLGNHYLKDILSICKGFRKLLVTQPLNISNTEFTQKLIAGLEQASQQTTEPADWWKNSTLLVELYQELGKSQTINKEKHMPPLDASRGNDPKF